MKRIVTLIGMAAVVAVDQLIKALVVRDLAPIGHTGDLWGIVRLRYVENTGAAFSLFSGKIEVLSVITVLILLVCLGILLSGKVESSFVYVCITLITAGGLGNVIDRIFRGFVVDYIEPVFVNFAVFNFADCFVTVGSFALVIYLVVQMVRHPADGKKAKL